MPLHTRQHLQLSDLYMFVCVLLLLLLLFLPVCWGRKGMFLMASDVGLYGPFLLISLSVSPQAFVPPPLPSTQLPALLPLQILQVAIPTFVSFSPFLINKRELSSNTMLIDPMLICSPILFVISLLSHCSWPLLRHWNGHQDYQWHINFFDSLDCPHLQFYSMIPLPLPHHILFPHLLNTSWLFIFLHLCMSTTW